MGGHVGEAGGGLGVGAAEDGGRWPQSMGGCKEDERVGRRMMTGVGEMGGHADRGGGGRTS
jgi:hypothetical protein